MPEIHLPIFRRFAALFAGALMLGCATTATAADLDGLEMDVLGPGERPSAAIPRISLPEPMLRDPADQPRGANRRQGGELLFMESGHDRIDQIRESGTLDRDRLEGLRSGQE